MKIRPNIETDSCAKIISRPTLRLKEIYLGGAPET